VQRSLDVTTALLSTLARAGTGMRVAALGARPARLLELYEFEACPFCRKVREALSMLDLEAMIYPCPKGGTRFRDEVKRRGGKLQFPYLVDPDAGVEMYESDAIVRHLFTRYGDGALPAGLRGGALSQISLALAGLPRAGKGVFRRASRAPEKPLELYGFEASPYCKIVREALCVLELPYLLHNVAPGSPSRPAFEARAGGVQVPYLVDPNTGSALFESAEIVRHLESTYAA
jgi:glutathione S-transferase